MPELKFLCDCHLGKLAKYLRILGYDTLYFRKIPDNEIVKIAPLENRIVLTRDKELSKRLKNMAFYIKPLSFKEQFELVYSHFRLKEHQTPFVRCTLCNSIVIEVQKELIETRLPQKTREFYDEFFICSNCGQIYWEGDHYKQMQKKLEELTGEVLI